MLNSSNNPVRKLSQCWQELSAMGSHNLASWPVSMLAISLSHVVQGLSFIIFSLNEAKVQAVFFTSITLFTPVLKTENTCLLFSLPTDQSGVQGKERLPFLMKMKRCSLLFQKHCVNFLTLPKS